MPVPLGERRSWLYGPYSGRAVPFSCWIASRDLWEVIMEISDRDLEIWKLHVRGRRQTVIGREFGISQQAVSQAIERVRKSIPAEVREEAIQQEIDFLRATRDEIMELWYAKAAPVTAGKDGEIVLDPETNEVVRDHSGRLHAARLGLAYTERAHKLLGLDAALRVDLGQSEETAARTAAAEALAHLHGGTESPDAD